MSLYSRNLGNLAVTDHLVLHDVYTVPLGGGPAVVKALTLYADAGAWVIVAVRLDGITPGAYLAMLNNTTGSAEAHQVIETFQPLPPGAKVVAINASSSTDWSVLMGGYQFLTP